MKLPRLQNLYWYACALMGAGFLVLGGMLIFHSLSEYQRLLSSENQLHRFASVVALANATAAERSPVIAALRVPTDEQLPLLQGIDTLRQETNESLQAVASTLAEEIIHDTDLAMRLHHFQLALYKARQEADQWMNLSHHIRQRADLFHTIDNMFIAADQAMQLRDGIAAKLMSHDPNLSGVMILGIISSNLREYAGRLSFYVSNLLHYDDPHAQPAWQQLIETKGQLVALGHLINNYGLSVHDKPDITESIAQIETQFFNQTLPWATRTVLQTYPRPSLLVFTENYLPALKPLEQLRTALEHDAFEQTRLLRVQASQTLLIASLVSLAVLAVFFYLNFLLRFGLFVPLLTAKRQIVALAHDDLREPSKQTQHSSYELQQMFDGITALRASQKRKQVLEYSQKKMSEQLRRLSETDPLTGLYNRRALELAAQTMMLPGDQQRQRVGLILFDIDHFKQINDTYGHAVGDQALQKTSAQLMPLIRPGDIFARFGGEEFIVLMPDVSDHEAEQMAETLRHALANSLYVDEQKQRPLTASFGVASTNTDEGDWESLVALADERMYFSKRRGRNQVTGPSNTRP